MNTLDAIFTRRSIRSYTDQKVDKKLIEEIISAAMYAPSAHNQQPWCFLVIDEKALLEKISNFHPYAKMAKSAPLGILICTDTKLHKIENYWIQDCSAATENLLLAAHDKGLGAVWTGIYFNKELEKNYTKEFNLPENILPFAFVVIGYPKEQKAKQERFDKKRIKYNNWN